MHQMNTESNALKSDCISTRRSGMKTESKQTMRYNQCKSNRKSREQKHAFTITARFYHQHSYLEECRVGAVGGCRLGTCKHCSHSHCNNYVMLSTRETKRDQKMAEKRCFQGSFYLQSLSRSLFLSSFSLFLSLALSLLSLFRSLALSLSSQLGLLLC